MPRITVHAIVLVFAAATSSQVLACALHVFSPNSIFGPTYPGSLSVAAAVGNARSENRLPGAPLDKGEAGLFRASIALKKLGRRFDAAAEIPRVDFFLIIAGQQMWTYYRVKKLSGQAEYAVHVHVAEPLHDVPVVVTSYFVVLALHNGDMTFTEAYDGGLIQVRNDKDGHIGSMFQETFSSRNQVS